MAHRRDLDAAIKNANIAPSAFRSGGITRATGNRAGWRKFERILVAKVHQLSRNRLKEGPMKIATPLMIAVMSCGLLRREGRGNNAVLRRVLAGRAATGPVRQGERRPCFLWFVHVGPGRRRIHEQGLAFGERRSNFVQADLAVEPCAMGLEHRPRRGRHKHQIHQYAKQQSVSHEERLLRGRLAKPRAAWRFHRGGVRSTM